MKFLTGILFTLLITSNGLSQTGNGTIQGKVTDTTKAVLPGVTVTATNIDTGVPQTTLSNNIGKYTLSLPAGVYVLSFELPSFATRVRRDVKLPPSETVTVNTDLEVSAESAKYEIWGGEYYPPLLNYHGSERKYKVTADIVEEIPGSIISGSNSAGIRNPHFVLQTLPGADWQQDSGIRINGTPGNTQAIRIEGIDATNNLWHQTSPYSQQSIDSVDEFEIMTSNYKAESGQSGTAIFNLTMKSGGSFLHGNIFEYLGNEAINASLPYSEDAYGNKSSPQSRRNDYGFTLGGLISIPKLYNGRNKSFFFLSFEQNREDITENIVGTVPIAAMRKGDFSAVKGTTPLQGNEVQPDGSIKKVDIVDALGRKVYENTINNWNSYHNVTNPSTGLPVRVWDPFPNNTIPENLMDPAALKIQRYIPSPDPGKENQLINNWTAHTSSNSMSYIPSLKIDHNFTDRMRISGYWSSNYSRQNTDDGLPKEISGSSPLEFTSHTVLINVTYSLSPTKLLQIGTGLMHHVYQQSPLTVDVFNAFGINTHTFVSPHISGLSSTSGGFSQTMGSTENARLVNIKPTANASLELTKGNHSLKFGTEIIFESNPSYSETYANNWYAFSTDQTRDPSLAATDITLPSGISAGFPYAGFITGRVGIGITNAPSRGHLGSHSFAFYIQDSWRATHHLTLDYGIRYDYQTYLKEQYGRWGSFSPTAKNPAADNKLGAITFEGSATGRCNCNYAKVYPFAVAPRIGIAYDRFFHTIFRAGAGIVYGRPAELGYRNLTLSNYARFSSIEPGAAASQLADGPPFQVQWPDYNAGAFPRLPWLDAPPVAIDHNAGRPPRIFQWSVGFARELFQNDMVIEVAYVGNRGSWWQSGSLIDINGVTADYLKSRYNLDIVNSSADRQLLMTKFSDVPDRNRFPLPFSQFPQNSPLIQALRPYPQFTSINTIGAPLGRTWYDALHVQVIKNNSDYINFNYSFTWQKELALGTESSFSSYPPQVNDAFRRSSNKHISSLSRPFINALVLNFRSPRFDKTNTWAHQLLRDWQFNVLLRYSSGLPIRVPDGAGNIQTLLARSNGTYADRVKGEPLFLSDINGNYAPAATLVLNPKAWADPAPGTFSTSSAYYSDYRGRRRPIENISMGRTFRFKNDGANLLVRMEFTNIFNRLFIPDPTSTDASATPRKDTNGRYTAGFGSINMYDPDVADNVRTGRIVARFNF